MKIYGLDLQGNISIGVDNSFEVGDDTHRLGTIFGNLFDGVALTSQYADLAEYYTLDNGYNIGDVLLINVNGETDGIRSNEVGSDKVLGIVSSKPGFLLDSKLANGVPVALSGKVPCRVIGSVKKGDRLISAEKGCACVGNTRPGETVARALESNSDEGIKTIMVKV